MKKLIFFNLLLMLSAFLLAQNELEIGINIRPQVNTAIGQDKIYDTTDSRGVKLNIAGGIRVDYNLNDDFSIVSGLFYQRHEIINETFEGVPSFMAFESKMHFLRLPALISFNISNSDNLNVKFIAGIALNYLVSANDNMLQLANFFTDANVKPENERYNKVLLDGQISVGVEKALSDKINIFSQADVITAITRFHSKSPDIIMNSRVISMGISFGIKYSL